MRQEEKHNKQKIIKTWQLGYHITFKQGYGQKTLNVIGKFFLNIHYEKMLLTDQTFHFEDGSLKAITITYC